MSEETNTPEEQAVYKEAVEKAKLLGWSPKEEYKGNPNTWRDAPEFLEFGERLNPILRENNKRLENELRESKAQIAQIKQQVDKFVALTEQTKAEAYKKAYADLKAQKIEALEQGDYVTATEVDEKMASTREAEKQSRAEVVAQPVKAIPANVKATYDQWAKENPWAVESDSKYDPEMDAYARAMGEIITRRNEVPATATDRYAVFLSMLTEKVKARFPEKFANEKRAEAPRTESGGEFGGSAPTKKHSYSHLPKEAQANCDALVKAGVLTKERYIETYPWDR